ncbi:MAG: glycosyltransferase family 4 protein [Verrucomicrobiota bacterium]
MLRIYLSLADPGNYGWGVCSKYLAEELAKCCEVISLSPEHMDWNNPNLPGVHLMALAGHLQTRSAARGILNIGYTFFEGRLSDQAIRNATYYDHIFVGSTWCQKLALEAGLKHTSVLIQGIDLELFHQKDGSDPSRKKSSSPFVVFSGSKIEYRKGQDLTIAAFKKIQELHDDIHLVTMWDNYLKDSIQTMSCSPHIKFELKGKDWEEKVLHLCKINGLDTSRIFVLPLAAHTECPIVYRESDMGIFPSRCESGTNLVLMEYMACGKPAIVSATGGHLDIINDSNVISLKELKNVEIPDYYEKSLSVTWQEASIDELIEKINYGYCQREEIREIGLLGAETMKQHTWSKTADRLVRKCEELLDNNKQ